MLETCPCLSFHLALSQPSGDEHGGIILLFLPKLGEWGLWKHSQWVRHRPEWSPWLLIPSLLLHACPRTLGMGVSEDMNSLAVLLALCVRGCVLVLITEPLLTDSYFCFNQNHMLWDLSLKPLRKCCWIQGGRVYNLLTQISQCGLSADLLCPRCFLAWWVLRRIPTLLDVFPRTFQKRTAFKH